MNKSALTCFILLLMITPPADAALDFESLGKSVGRVICFNKVNDELEPSTAGSGFVVDDKGLFATNAHLFAGRPEKIMVFFSADDYTEAHVWVKNDKLDLALLKLVRGRHLPLIISYGERPAIGHKLSTLGFPGAADLFVENQVLKSYVASAASGTRPTVELPKGIMEPKLSQGPLSSIQFDPATDRKTLLCDLTMGSGNSGGPVFDQCGNVIGIAAFGYQTANWAIDAAEILPLLDQAGAQAVLVDSTCSPAKPWAAVGIVAAVIIALAALVIALKKPRVIRDFTRRISRRIIQPGTGRGEISGAKVYFLKGVGYDSANLMLKLSKAPFTIGSLKPVCNLTIGNIAKKHMQAMVDEGNIIIRDVYSGRGILLDGTAIKPGTWTRVSPGQTIKLGSDGPEFTAVYKN